MNDLIGFVNLLKILNSFTRVSKIFIFDRNIYLFFVSFAFDRPLALQRILEFYFCFSLWIWFLRRLSGFQFFMTRNFFYFLLRALRRWFWFWLVPFILDLLLVVPKKSSRLRKIWWCHFLVSIVLWLLFGLFMNRILRVLRLLNWNLWRKVLDLLRKIIGFLYLLRLVLWNDSVHFPRSNHFFKIDGLRIFYWASNGNFIILVHQLFFFFMEQSAKLSKLSDLNLDSLQLDIIINSDIKVNSSLWLPPGQVLFIFLFSLLPALLILLWHSISLFQLFRFLRVRTGLISARMPHDLGTFLAQVVLVRLGVLILLFLSFHTRFWNLILFSLKTHLSNRVQNLRALLWIG